jgi:hypothetical protein
VPDAQAEVPPAPEVPAEPLPEVPAEPLLTEVPPEPPLTEAPPEPVLPPEPPDPAEPPDENDPHERTKVPSETMTDTGMRERMVFMRHLQSCRSLVSDKWFCSAAISGAKLTRNREIEVSRTLLSANPYFLAQLSCER